jgi:serine/threonine-protein kinase
VAAGTPEAGDLVGDRYRLTRRVGEGGMGSVWEAREVATDEPFALKLLKSEKEEDRKRFQREVRAARAIVHPNVIEVHELIELPDGTLAIVMDLLEGETLGAVLRRDQRISVRDLAKVFLPVLDALAAAHVLGIVHRDLKPDNVFLCGNEDALDVKVLDFGVAKLTAEEGLAARTQALTGTGSMVGTPYYMSPEQVYAEKDLDASADVWSLGIVFYECLTGVRPTEADSVGKVLRKIMLGDFTPLTTHRADLPEDVVALVARMLSVERKERPQNLGEIREVLERHASPGFPTFSRAKDIPAIDPHAETIATPRDLPPSPISLAAKDGGHARADTNRGLSVAPPSRKRERTRLVAAGALAVVALLGVAVALRGEKDDDRAKVPATTSLEPIRTAEPSAIIPEAPSAAKPPDVATPTSASASAVPVVASAAPAPPPRVAPPMTVARPVAPAVSGPRCEAGEVLSEGHCCPRGHAWRGGRCERPLATSF